MCDTASRDSVRYVRIACDVDSADENRGPFDESAGLVHGEAGCRIDPDLAANQTLALLSGSDLEDIHRNLVVHEGSRVVKLIVCRSDGDGRIWDSFGLFLSCEIACDDLLLYQRVPIKLLHGVFGELGGSCLSDRKQIGLFGEAWDGGFDLKADWPQLREWIALLEGLEVPSERQCRSSVLYHQSGFFALGGPDE